MDSIAETMQAVLRRKSDVPSPARVAVAREIMSSRLVTLKPEQPLEDVIAALLRGRVSGGPVVDERGRLVGMISQMDCIKRIAAGSYHQEELGQRATARSIMSEQVSTITPDTDLYRIAQIFLEGRYRRLPVVDGTKLVGQVSPRDVLRAVIE